MEALLAAGSARTWSKADLARAADVSPHGGIDDHVQGFLRIGLVEIRDGGYALTDPPPEYVRSLAGLLSELQTLPDR